MKQLVEVRVVLCSGFGEFIGYASRERYEEYKLHGASSIAVKRYDGTITEYHRTQISWIEKIK